MMACRGKPMLYSPTLTVASFLSGSLSVLFDGPLRHPIGIGQGLAAFFLCHLLARFLSNRRGLDKDAVHEFQFVFNSGLARVHASIPATSIIFKHNRVALIAMSVDGHCPRACYELCANISTKRLTSRVTKAK
jgi:hypothetical protein